ncbi:PREDICTED: NADH dehydrogenase [ubiquinone] 1 beta subcomplex subunit 4 [Gavialis gangeticus]|uniref:NADH dehydrogenase [ubiquinone] 1 beta subcomplex subunit 4 n=1 Tax=Gavialis gangeticus TaxID=94835 RepID=UPI00092F3B8E|nr:PREDICTED: NADH dehydrogenase [ubiquinone] 1 beta subcomplex subunit 4 [Gavialis gangeticus]
MADSSRLKGVGYKPLVGVSLPRTLDPAEYQQSEQTRRQQAERLAIRARLKLEYQLKLNDPHRQGLIEDPAMLRWTYARANVYPHFKPTLKTSIMGLLWGVGPIVFWTYVFLARRAQKEKEIKEGKHKLLAHLKF